MFLIYLFFAVTCAHRTFRRHRRGEDLVPISLANSRLNESHAHILTFFPPCKHLVCSFYIYHSSNGDICIFPPLPDCVYDWICFWVELSTKSNLWGMHINRQIQIMGSPHAHTTQIYQIWCGWHCLQWKIIGMSQHVSSIIMNDARKRKVTAEDRGIM